MHIYYSFSSEGLGTRLRRSGARLSILPRPQAFPSNCLSQEEPGNEATLTYMASVSLPLVSYSLFGSLYRCLFQHHSCRRQPRPPATHHHDVSTNARGVVSRYHYSTSTCSFSIHVIFITMGSLGTRLENSRV